MKSESPFVIQITTGTLLRGLLLVTAAFLLYYLRDLVLVVLTAIVISSSIEPAVLWMVRYRVRRIQAVAIVYLLLAIFFVGGFYFLLPPLLQDTAGILSKIPEQVDILGLPITQQDIVSNLDEVSSVLQAEQLVQGFQNVLTGAAGGLVSFFGLVFGGVVGLILIIVLSFYFAVQETGVDDFLRVVTPLNRQEYVLGLWRRAQKKIGLWMQGQVILSFLVAVLLYLPLVLFSVPHPFLLAVFAGLCEFIPVFGAFLAALPALFLAFSDGGVTLFLIVIGIYVVVQQFESHLIYPLVVRKVVGVPPVLVILSLVAGWQLAGFLGVILSVPIAAGVREYVDDLLKARSA